MNAHVRMFEGSAIETSVSMGGHDIHQTLPSATGLPPGWRETVSIRAMSVMFDSCQQAQEAFLGVLNQPRAEGIASDFIEEEQGRLFTMMEEIAREMAVRAPVDDFERDERARTLIAYRYIQCGDQPAAFFALAEKAAADMITIAENA